MTVLTRYLMGSDISDLMYKYYRQHFRKLVFGKINRLEVYKKLEDWKSQRRFSAVHWKLHIVTVALQNYKFVENLWEIYVSLLAVYVTLQQPQKV